MTIETIHIIVHGVTAGLLVFIPMFGVTVLPPILFSLKLSEKQDKKYAIYLSIIYAFLLIVFIINRLLGVGKVWDYALGGLL